MTKHLALADIVIGLLLALYFALGVSTESLYSTNDLYLYAVLTFTIYIALAFIICCASHRKNNKDQKTTCLSDIKGELQRLKKKITGKKASEVNGGDKVKKTTCLFYKEEVDKDQKTTFLLDKEEVDKELSLIILSIIGYLFFLGFSDNQIATPYHDIGNYLLLSIVIGIELFIFSLLSFLFKFSKGPNNPQKQNHEHDEHMGYHKSYHLLEYPEEDDQEKTIKLIKPVVFFIQLIKVILVLVVILSILKIFNIKGADNIGAIFASAGGSFAILAFAFKESLRSITAGIRIWTDDLIEVGEIIQADSLGIFGKVEKISLTNIKIQNFDNTISNVPLEKIISSKIINHSEFKIHGRRINFTITIDTDSIRVLTDTDKDEKTWIKIKDIKVLKKYIKKKNESMKDFKDKDSISYANNRKHTNIGIFRAYIREYLKAHPFINSKKGINIRNLSPGKDGLPVLVKAHVNNYAISGEIFRTVESDIIDHVVSVMKVFDLKILQYKKD